MQHIFQSISFFLHILFFLKFYFIWPCRAAGRILVLQPGIAPVFSALRAQSLNHSTAGQLPNLLFKSPKGQLIPSWVTAFFKPGSSFIDDLI